jgi:hypothetical protein
MNNNSTEPMHQFISWYNLKRKDGLLLFDAAVSFYNNKKLHTIDSEVQVIMLPDQIALYVLELLKGEFNVPEMYCTTDYSFVYTATNQLEIRHPQTNAPYLISIKPV